jgi:hypothetical protein
VIFSSFFAMACSLSSTVRVGLVAMSTRMFPSATGSLRKTFRRCFLSFLASLRRKEDAVRGRVLVLLWQGLESCQLTGEGWAVDVLVHGSVFSN